MSTIKHKTSYLPLGYGVPTADADGKLHAGWTPEGEIAGTINVNEIPKGTALNVIGPSNMTDDGTTVTVDAILEVADGAERFVKIPAMANGDKPSSPAVGMIIYNTTTKRFEFYQSDPPSWQTFDNADYLRTDEYWTSETKGSDSDGNGGRENPFKTIQHVIDTYGTSSTHKVIYVDHQATESLQFLTGVRNITIVGVGVIDTQQTRIIGNHLLYGANNTRIRFKNIILEDAADNYILDITETEGRHSFQNVTFVPGAVNKLAVKLYGNNSNWHAFYDCFVDGIVDCLSTDPTMTIAFSRQLGQNFVLNMDTFVSVIIILGF
jgi:hypothetical protein